MVPSSASCASALAHDPTCSLKFTTVTSILHHVRWRNDDLVNLKVGSVKLLKACMQDVCGSMLAHNITSPERFFLIFICLSLQIVG
jgi:hypothetical protein